MNVNEQSPLPVMDYNMPRADQVPRRKYVVMLALAAVLGAGLLGVVVLRLLPRPGAATVVARANAAPNSRVVVMPAAPVQVDPGQFIAEARTRANQARLNDLMVNRLGANQVVYEEEPVAARRLYGKGVCNQQASRRDMSQPFFGAFEPPVYRTDGFWHDNPDTQKNALLFAHQLRSANGNLRLVLLEMEVKLDGTKLANDEYKVAINRKLTYRICQPKLSGTWPDEVRSGVSLKILQGGERNVIPIKWVDGTLRSARPTEYNLRFFAGQPDPKDPSHFTVEYEIQGVKNVIDGWLTDDDFLRIVPRGGAVDKGNWQIEAGK